jgi:putative glutamine amidotransferase
MTLIVVTASDAKEAEPYIAAAEKQGAQTRLLTPPRFTSVADAMHDVGGLLLCGGFDVHPKYYGQEIDPQAGVETWVERDEMELAVLRHALFVDMPVLAICRGMQLLNVAFGGSLLQDVPGHGIGNGEKNDTPVTHPIYVSPGSKLAAIVGGGAFYKVNSWHHQGLKERNRAPNLLSTAYHPEDGMVEGLESTRHTWVVGVQCHPEREKELPKGFQKLFFSLNAWAAQFLETVAKAPK